MKKHEDCRILPYPPEAVYEVVADIERYPEFLPWCQAARIRSTKAEGNLRWVEADLVIAFPPFRERFGSKVRLDPENLRIDVDYLDGPFRSLQNHWHFFPDPQGCKAEFMVCFEFRSKLLQLAIGQVFEQAMRKLVQAFEDRLKALHGQSG